MVVKISSISIHISRRQTLPSYLTEFGFRKASSLWAAGSGWDSYTGSPTISQAVP